MEGTRMNVQLLAVIANGPVVLYYILQKLGTREIYYVTAKDSHKLFNRTNIIYLDVDSQVHTINPDSPLLEASGSNPSLVVSLSEGQRMIRELNAVKLESNK